MDDTDTPDLRISICLESAEATACLASRLAPKLRPGDAVLVEGPIGAGKSHFCRSLIQHLLAAEGRAEDIPSPTYTLVQIYELADVEIWHADLYRLAAPDEVFELGLDEAFETAISLVEWPDRLGPAAPDRALTLRLQTQEDADTRIATLSARSPRWAPILTDLQEQRMGSA